MKKKNINIEFNFTPVKLEHFSDFSAWWFENLQGIELSTKDSYRYTMIKLNETFGSFKLSEIRPYHIETYLRAAYDSGLSRSYVSKLRAMLNQICRKAQANGLIPQNPVELAAPIHLTVSDYGSPLDSEKDSFSLSEVHRMMDDLPKDKIGDAIRLLLCSGLRTQEALALEPMHIQFNDYGPVVQVRQAVKVVKGVASLGCPKTTGSFRDVLLPKIAEEPLRRLLAHADTFLIPGASSTQPYNPRAFRRVYLARLDACGVRHLSPHCCRHTYVSQLQAASVPLTTIRTLVGHNREKTTLKYLHIQDELWQEAAESLNTRYVC